MATLIIEIIAIIAGIIFAILVYNGSIRNDK